MLIARRPLALLVLVLIALTPAGLLAQGYTDHPQIPEGTVGAEGVAQVLAAFNAGTEEAIGACIAERFTGEFAEIPVAEHVEAWNGWRRGSGPVEFVSVRTYDPPREGSLVVILRSELLGTFRAFSFGVDENGKYTGMRFNPARPPSYLNPVPMSFEESIDELDALITRLADAGVFSGTVVVAKDGVPVLERACGEACRRYDVPNRIDTKFNIGSMNKMFTAVSVAQLAEAGKLSYDDYVGEWLPEYPNEAVREKVQIKHLLSHTSGMGSHFTDEFDGASKARFRSIDDYVDLFAGSELAFEPGTEWSYSNAGYYVLGLVIEAASGQSYYDYVREHVYGPAGMVNSDSYDMDIPVKNLAEGYTTSHLGGLPEDGARWMRDGVRNNYFMHSIKGGPAGGGFSTTPDLTAFARALVDGTLVSPATFETLTTPKPELGSESYGYGFVCDERPDIGRIVGHGGGFPGINANLELYLDKGLSIAVVSNLDESAAIVSRRFLEMMVNGY